MTKASEACQTVASRVYMKEEKSEFILSRLLQFLALAIAKESGQDPVVSSAIGDGRETARRTKGAIAFKTSKFIFTSTPVDKIRCLKATTLILVRLYDHSRSRSMTVFLRIIQYHSATSDMNITLGNPSRSDAHFHSNLVYKKLEETSTTASLPSPDRGSIVCIEHLH